MNERNKPSPAEVKKLICMLQTIKVEDTLYIDKKVYKRLQKIIGLLEYKSPMTISEYLLYSNPFYNHDKTLHSQYFASPLCPRCRLPTERDYQRYCTGCGQRLKWVNSKMKLHDTTHHL